MRPGVAIGGKAGLIGAFSSRKTWRIRGRHGYRTRPPGLCLRQVYFYYLMGAIVVRSGQDFHIKTCNIMFPIDRDRRFKIIVSDRGFFLLPCFSYFPLPT